MRALLLVAALAPGLIGCGADREAGRPAESAREAEVKTTAEAATDAGARADAAAGSEPVIRSAGELLGRAIDVIPTTILPRAVEQDYVETLRKADAGATCALLVRPVVRTPREGPWKITFVAPNGQPAVSLPPQRLDPVTGQITFVARTDYFGPGEWTIELDLVEGGMTHGPERQVFRFRVE